MSSRLTAADPALETFGGGIVVADDLPGAESILRESLGEPRERW